MDRVAAEAGTGVGTVYRRFRDRPGLLYALLDDDEKRFQTAFLFGPPPLGPGAPPADRIRAFLQACIERHELTAQLMAVVERHSPTSRNAPYLAWRNHLSALIEEAEPSLDAPYTADALLAVVGARLYLHHKIDRGYSAERIRQGLDDLLGRLLPG